MANARDWKKPDAHGWRVALDFSASIAIVVVSAALFWRIVSMKPPETEPGSKPRPDRPSLSAPRDPVNIQGASVKGNSRAEVAIIQYSEFECPFCGSFVRDTLPQIEKSYIESGKVLLVFRHLPLESIHRFAFGAGVAAECAGRQGKFWEMHDLLFKDRRRLDESTLYAHSRTLGLNEREFQTCSRGMGPQRVQLDSADARKLGITGTPTFLIGRIEEGNRVRVSVGFSGAAQFSRFQVILDKLLADGRRISAF